MNFTSFRMYSVKLFIHKSHMTKYFKTDGVQIQLLCIFFEKLIAYELFVSNTL